MKKVSAVNCLIPGGFDNGIEFLSKGSLLDGDMVIFNPELPRVLMMSADDWKGKPLLIGKTARLAGGAIDHWTRELKAALEAGMNVFLMMAECEEFYIRFQQAWSTREQEIHTLFRSNYHMLPDELDVIQSEGSEMMLSQGENPLKQYWEHYANESRYKVYISGGRGYEPLLTTREGRRVVGAIRRYASGGALVALPWLDLDREEFFSDYIDEDDEPCVEWTPKAKGWGLEFIKILSAMDDELRHPTEDDTPPEWAIGAAFETLQEKEFKGELSDIGERIRKLEGKSKAVRAQLLDASSLKPLLYAKGHTLEDAIISAMRLLGFQANRFRDGESEFDAVLECPEGRLIGEAEGKDSRPINIDKMRQLVTNVIEDHSRDEVEEEATGILFGNAYRLRPISERPEEQFTAKCVNSAKTHNTVLMRTSDLFEIARSLADDPDDEFATECRKAIFAARGGEVHFPSRQVAG